jgi:hypothetical protein
MAAGNAAAIFNKISSSIDYHQFIIQINTYYIINNVINYIQNLSNFGKFHYFFK